MLRIFHVIVIPLILAVCLLGDHAHIRNIPIIRDILGGFLSLLKNQPTQWSLVIALCVILIWLSHFQLKSSFLRFSNPDLWLVALGIIGLISYIYCSSDVSFSGSVFVLLLGVAYSKCARLRVLWPKNNRLELIILGDFIVLVLGLLFGLFSHPSGPIYRYHNIQRWTGIWQEPNTFGLLMGVGFTLSLGVLMLNFASNQECNILKIYEIEERETKLNAWPFLIMVFFAMSAGCMTMGLVNSLSRGAWLGVFLAMLYLMIQAIKTFTHQGSCVRLWLRNSALSLVAIILALMVLTFWQFHHIENSVPQKAISVTNMNDFSWQNRIAAWEGALQIMAEHPFLGLAWGKLKPCYENYYLPSKLNESEAIQVNDYFMFGATLGIPMFFCLGMYFWLSFTDKSETSIGKKYHVESEWLKTGCHAGAIVLLTGFWFDGGLFNLPIAMTFWVLLEMGSVELPSRNAGGDK